MVLLNQTWTEENWLFWCQSVAGFGGGVKFELLFLTRESLKDFHLCFSFFLFQYYLMHFEGGREGGRLKVALEIAPRWASTRKNHLVSRVHIHPTVSRLYKVTCTYINQLAWSLSSNQASSFHCICHSLFKIFNSVSRSRSAAKLS